MKTDYTLHKEHGILECHVYSIKNSDLLKKEDDISERLGIPSVKEKIYGVPAKIVINIKNLEEIIYFIPNKIEIYEEGNFVEGTHIEFKDNLDFIVLIPFEEFKELYFDYIDLKVENNGI
jgi:hypothetical protein